MIDTSEGTIVVALDAAAYPKSVNNFVFLAENKFYDGSLFNRVAQDFVDPGRRARSNTAAGGPGYSVPGEVPTGDAYLSGGRGGDGQGRRGPAGTAGSQFFIVDRIGANARPHRPTTPASAR